MENNKNSNTKLIAGSILIIGVIIAGAILIKNHPAPTTPKDDQNKGNITSTLSDIGNISSEDVVLGNPNAKVTYIEYGDYQCPVCGVFFSQIEPQLKKDYIDTGKVKFVFRSFQFLGQESFDSAAAVLCAKDQGKFYEFSNAIYTAENLDGKERNGNLNKDLFLKIADQIGLDKATFTTCYDSGKYVEKIKSDSDKIQSLGVNSTPTSVINGTVVVGLDYGKIKSTIDAALK